MTEIEQLEQAYMSKIDGAFAAESIAYLEAKILLANYLAAVTAESGLIGDNIQSWTMAGKTFTKRDMMSMRPANFYRQQLVQVLGEEQAGSFVSMGGRVYEHP